MKESLINFYSHRLNANVKILVSGHWGKPLLMFPTSMGNVYQNKEFGLLDSISQQINEGKFKVYNVETFDNLTFYDKWVNPETRIYKYELYTQFLKEELLPFIQRENYTHRALISGCSFGAYHAANFAFKNPDLIERLICMSGSFDISSFLDGFHNDYVYFNNPVEYMTGASSWQYNHMEIILGTSDWDNCLQSNIRMSEILNERQIRHWFDEKKWANHDWPLWRQMLPQYLQNL